MSMNTDLSELVRDEQEHILDLSDYAVENCRDCHGNGYVIENEHSGSKYVCSCTDKAIAKLIVDELASQFDYYYEH